MGPTLLVSQQADERNPFVVDQLSDPPNTPRHYQSHLILLPVVPYWTVSRSADQTEPAETEAAAVSLSPSLAQPQPVLLVAGWARLDPPRQPVSVCQGSGKITPHVATEGSLEAE